MIAYVGKTLGAHFRSGRMLFLLSVLGVALGVASVLSIQILNRNALGAFQGSVRAVSGDAQLSVLPRATSTLPEALFAAVLADPDVEAAWPLFRLDVALAGRDDFYLEVLGFDLFLARKVPWSEPPRDFGEALATPGWSAVSPELAESLGVHVKDSLEVTSGSRRVTLRIGALVDFRKLTPLASARLVVMDIAQAQSLFGGRGEIHQIDVVLRPGADATAVQRRLGERLGPSVQLETPEQRQQEAAGLLGAFRLNLTALSLISLFVGAFLVYVSTQASLVRRRREIGVLRALGATREQTLGVILAEVTLLGVIGTALGIPLGRLVAALNVDMVSATLTNLYMLEAIETLQLPGWLMLLGVALGIGGALLGALAPALEVTRKDPRDLLASFPLQERLARSSRPLLALGLALLLGSLAIGWIAGAELRPAGFVVAFGVLLGVPMLTPWLMEQGTRGLRPASFGLRYGIKALALRLQTTAFAVAALALAISMLVGITLMIGSFRRTVEIWITSTLQADVYVTTESWRRAREGSELAPAVIGRLAAQPGVAAMDRLRQLFVYTGERRILLSGVDGAIRAERGRFELLEGRLDRALDAMRREGAVLISEPLARKEGLGVGDVLELAGPRGPLRFPVSGVMYDYSSELGIAVVDLETMEAAFGPGTIQNVALYLEPGVDAAQVIGRIRAELGALPLIVRSNRELREEVFTTFDQTFAVTRLLQIMSLIIAAAGITLTLLVLARERVSELALYRALGATRAQIFGVFLGKGLGIALFGLSLGLIGGVLLALVLILLVNRAYFGWTIAMHWPWPDLIQQIGTIFGAAIVASVYPALRASSTPATELSRESS